MGIEREDEMVSQTSHQRRGPPRPAHPYLDWAIETKFAYLRPGDWVPLLVEFVKTTSRKEFIALNWLRKFKEQDAVRAPALFDEVFQERLVKAKRPFNFGMLLVRRTHV